MAYCFRGFVEKEIDRSHNEHAPLLYPNLDLTGRVAEWSLKKNVMSQAEIHIFYRQKTFFTGRLEKGERYSGSGNETSRNSPNKIFLERVDKWAIGNRSLRKRNESSTFLKYPNTLYDSPSYESTIKSGKARNSFVWGTVRRNGCSWTRKGQAQTLSGPGTGELPVCAGSEPAP